MKQFNYILIFLSVLFSSYITTAVAGPGTPFNKIVFFGDSLSDNGNLYAYDLGFMPKPPQYFQGRFSNGIVWSEHFAKKYQDQAAVTSVNYAFGGETVLLHNPFASYLPYTLTDSYYSYLTRTVLSSRTNTLFVIFIGANDYLNGVPNVDKATTEVVNYLKSTIAGFIYHGGKNFLIIDLPNLAKSPYATIENRVEMLDQVTKAHNQKLAIAVEELAEQYKAVNIKLYSAEKLLDKLYEDPDQINKKHNTHISITDQSCWQGGYTLVRPNGNEPLRQTSVLEDLNAYLDQQKLMRSVNSDSAANKLDRERLASVIEASPALREAWRVGKGGLVPCDNGDDYLFWDKVHPTRAAHKVIADEIIDFVDQNFDHV